MVLPSPANLIFYSLKQMFIFYFIFFNQACLIGDGEYLYILATTFHWGYSFTLNATPSTILLLCKL